METIKKWFTIERIIIIVLLLLLVFGGNWFRGKYSSQVATIDSLTLANQSTTVIINKLQEEVYQQKIVITEKDKFLITLTDTLFNLKKRDERRIKDVIAYYSERTRTKIDTFEVRYTDTLVEYITEVDENTIDVPKTVIVDSPDFKLDVTILPTKLRINNISILDSQYVRVVEVKNGWFKLRTLEIQAIHTNDKIKVLSQNSIIYKPKQRGKWVARALILAGGIFIGTQIK